MEKLVCEPPSCRRHPEERRAYARAATIQPVQKGTARLVHLRWPKEDVVDNVDLDGLSEDDFDDPGDQPYVALLAATPA